MFNWLRSRLGLWEDRGQAHVEYTILVDKGNDILESLGDLHKRMDRIETALGPWREDGVGIQTGISRGRDPNDPKVQNESAAIGAKAIAAINAEFAAAFPPKYKHDDLGPYYGNMPE